MATTSIVSSAPVGGRIIGQGKRATGEATMRMHMQEDAKFEERVKEVHAFNVASAWRKRGIAITPVRCGPPHPSLQLVLVA